MRNNSGDILREKHMDWHLPSPKCTNFHHAFTSTNLYPDTKTLECHGLENCQLKIQNRWHLCSDSWLSRNKMPSDPTAPIELSNHSITYQSGSPHQMLKGHLCPLPDMGNLGPGSHRCPEKYLSLWALSVVSAKTIIHPNHEPGSAALESADMFQGSGGALLWSSALKATLRPPSSLPSAALGAALVLAKPAGLTLLFWPSICHEVPWKVGHFHLKTYQGTDPNLLKASTLKPSAAPPLMSWKTLCSRY